MFTGEASPEATEGNSQLKATVHSNAEPLLSDAAFLSGGREKRRIFLPNIWFKHRVYFKNASCLFCSLVLRCSLFTRRCQATTNRDSKQSSVIRTESLVHKLNKWMGIDKITWTCLIWESQEQYYCSLKPEALYLLFHVTICLKYWNI